MSNRELELAVWLDGADGPISPLRMMGAGPTAELALRAPPAACRSPNPKVND